MMNVNSLTNLTFLLMALGIGKLMGITMSWIFQISTCVSQNARFTIKNSFTIQSYYMYVHANFHCLAIEKKPSCVLYQALICHHRSLYEELTDTVDRPLIKPTSWFISDNNDSCFYTINLPPFIAIMAVPLLKGLHKVPSKGF